MVVNLEQSNEDGSHWIGLFAKTREHIFYFDSYGIDSTRAPYDLVEKYLKENYNRITRNTIPFQSTFSSVCGHYCIFFIYYMSLGSSFNELIQVLRKTDCPDSYVKSFVALLLV